MGVRVFVETVFENGDILTHEVGHICRPLVDADPETLGLQLEETKGLLKRLQKVVVRDQIDELLNAARNCSACGKRRAIHDDRGRSLDTLYGRFRVKSPRLRPCPCKSTAVAATSVLQSPLADRFPERATLELQRLQAELGSRHSFREAARLMETFLPCAPQSKRQSAIVWRALLRRLKRPRLHISTQAPTPNRRHRPFSWTALISGADQNTKSATLML